MSSKDIDEICIVIKKIEINCTNYTLPSYAGGPTIDYQKFYQSIMGMLELAEVQQKNKRD